MGVDTCSPSARAPIPVGRRAEFKRCMQWDCSTSTVLPIVNALEKHEYLSIVQADSPYISTRMGESVGK